MHELLRHPEAYRKAQEEVDSVVGTGPIKVEHLSKLKYLPAVSRYRIANPRGTSAVRRGKAADYLP